MFGLGAVELIVLGLLIFLVLGPERIPEMLKKLAFFTREVTKARDDITRAWKSDESLDEVRSSLQETRNVLRPDQWIEPRSSGVDASVSAVEPPSQNAEKKESDS